MCNRAQDLEHTGAVRVACDVGMWRVACGGWRAEDGAWWVARGGEGMEWDLLRRIGCKRAYIARSAPHCIPLARSQIFLSGLLLHAADISNPAKPCGQYLNWTDRVLAEFYGVGDLERSRGRDISMFCDRTQPKVAKCQAVVPSSMGAAGRQRTGLQNLHFCLLRLCAGCMCCSNAHVCRLHVLHACVRCCADSATTSSTSSPRHGRRLDSSTSS